MAAVIFSGIVLGIFFYFYERGRAGAMHESSDVLKLPAPKTGGPLSLEQAFLKRRSVRDFADSPISLSELSQLLWAAQGVTRDGLYRNAPSAGALYPLELYVAAGNVADCSPGIYRYLPGQHALTRVYDRDVRAELSRAALGQSCVARGSCVIVIGAVFSRITSKYRDRGVRYAHMEAGHVSQNIYLQAAALGLGTVAVGAFNDERVRSVMRMEDNEAPLYIMPVGKPK